MHIVLNCEGYLSDNHPTFPNYFGKLKSVNNTDLTEIRIRNVVERRAI